MIQTDRTIPPELVRAYEQTLFTIYLDDGNTITREVVRRPRGRCRGRP